MLSPYPVIDKVVVEMKGQYLMIQKGVSVNNCAAPKLGGMEG